MRGSPIYETNVQRTVNVFNLDISDEIGFQNKVSLMFDISRNPTTQLILTDSRGLFANPNAERDRCSFVDPAPHFHESAARLDQRLRCCHAEANAFF